MNATLAAQLWNHYSARMKHPFEHLSPKAQRNGYWLALAATLVIAFLLQSLSAPYCTAAPGETARYNIVHFEFAGKPEKAQTIVDSWGEAGRAALVNQVLVDYAFLIAYPSAIALGILLVLRNTSSRRAWAFGRFLAWGQLAAGLLDAIENAALIGILRGHVQSPLPEIAYWCAAPKFALVLAGVLFILAGLALSYSRVSEAAANS